MEILASVLPILLYILGSILLVTLIILTIKLIQTVDRANGILNDLEEKAKTLNGLFNVIEGFSGAISAVGDRVIESISGLIVKLFKKKKRKKEIKNESEDYYE